MRAIARAARRLAPLAHVPIRCAQTRAAGKGGGLAGSQLAIRNFAISRAIASKACTRAAPLLAA
jgi:hypothetical protein